jgi:hypothetical protein
MFLVKTNIDLKEEMTEIKEKKTKKEEEPVKEETEQPNNKKQTIAEQMDEENKIIAQEVSGTYKRKNGTDLIVLKEDNTCNLPDINPDECKYSGRKGESFFYITVPTYNMVFNENHFLDNGKGVCEIGKPCDAYIYKKSECEAGLKKYENNSEYKDGYLHCTKDNHLISVNKVETGIIYKEVLYIKQ